MTGGYSLLVPAGLAVMLSFIIQRYLSRFVKYGSLYEAQLADRTDSPAHQLEQVDIAVRLLEHGGITWPGEVTHVRLLALLQSGLQLDLEDGSKLMGGVLKPESSWTGKEIQARTSDEAVLHTKIVTVLRGTSVLLARDKTVLQPGDRLMVVVQPEGVAALAKELGPLTAQSENDSHLTHDPQAA
jgi:CIC family chloride channel protein